MLAAVNLNFAAEPTVSPASVGYADLTDNADTEGPSFALLSIGYVLL